MFSYWVIFFKDIFFFHVIVIVFFHYGPCKQTPLSRVLPQMSHPRLVFYFDFYHPLKMLSKYLSARTSCYWMGFWSRYKKHKNVKTENTVSYTWKSTWRHVVDVTSFHVPGLNEAHNPWYCLCFNSSHQSLILLMISAATQFQCSDQDEKGKIRSLIRGSGKHCSVSSPGINRTSGESDQDSK